MRSRLLALESRLDPHLVELLIGGVIVVPLVFLGAATIIGDFSALLGWILLALGCLPPLLLFAWIFSLVYRLGANAPCKTCGGKGYTVNEGLMCLEPCQCRDEEVVTVVVNTQPRGRTSGLAERAL
jgi:hypothetical protein